MAESLPGDLERAQEHHRRLTEDLARVADLSAEVHEQAAQVHEELPDARLDPEALRAHAERDRRLAATERERLEDL